MRIQHSRIHTLRKGFTLVELIAALVIISLVFSIALPNYFEMRERGRQAMVVENMRCVQLACEAYAADFEGYYPEQLEAPGKGFAYYFPGGDEELQSRAGLYPRNPYTNQYMQQWEFLRQVYASRGDNRDYRITGPNDVQLVWPGVIRYAYFQEGRYNRTVTYGIVGARIDNRSIRFDGRIVVLHN